MSLFWSQLSEGSIYYNAETVKALKCSWNANIVRAAMGVDKLNNDNGYLADPSQKQKIFDVVDAAIANCMYVIIDWHSHTAQLNQADAVKFFDEVSKKYAGVPNVLYEDYNEPTNVNWDQLKPYHQAIYDAIRKNDKNAIILMGTPNWDQDVDLAAQSPLTGVTNVMYTLHFYAGTHKDALIAKAQAALDKGLPLFVSEWGTVNADGGGAVDEASTAKWIAFLDKNNMSYLNWAIEDKSEGAAALLPGTSASQVGDDSKLTASGKYVKAMIKSKNTGVSKC